MAHTKRFIDQSADGRMMMMIKAGVPKVTDYNNTPQVIPEREADILENVRRFLQEGEVGVKALKKDYHEKLNELRSIEHMVPIDNTEQSGSVLYKRIANIGHELGLYSAGEQKSFDYNLAKKLLHIVELDTRAAVRRLEVKLDDRTSRLRRANEIYEDSGELSAKSLHEISLLLDIPIQLFFQAKTFEDHDRR